MSDLEFKEFKKKIRAIINKAKPGKDTSKEDVDNNNNKSKG